MPTIYTGRGVLFGYKLRKQFGYTRSPDHGSYLGGSKEKDRQWTDQSHGYKYAEDCGADRQVQPAYVLQSYIPHTYGAAMYR